MSSSKVGEKGIDMVMEVTIRFKTMTECDKKLKVYKSFINNPRVAVSMTFIKEL